MEREQIDAVLRLAAAQVSDDRQPLTEVVADGWLRQLDADDHAERTAADVCGALLSHWQFADLPEDPWLGTALARYFPAKLRDEFGAYIPRHPLRREIVATHVLNSMVNRVGATFVHRLGEMTGATPAQVCAPTWRRVRSCVTSRCGSSSRRSTTRCPMPCSPSC